MIPYAFYSGAGNRFVMIDDRAKKLPLLQSQWISRLCRATQPAADGVIIAEDSALADAKMRIFNRDGSEAEMCGNGLRTFIRFLSDLGISKKIYKVETLASQQMGLLEGEIAGDEIEVIMGKPHSFCWDIPLTIDGKVHLVQFLNTGVPHAVIAAVALEAIDVEDLGRKVRFHPTFAPGGTNVTFMTLNGARSLSIRTYERGVEGETQACGTGAVAAGVVAAMRLGIEPPLEVFFVSKEKVTLSFALENHHPSVVRMRGPAKKIGQGYFVCSAH